MCVFNHQGIINFIFKNPENMFSQSPYISNGFIRKTQFYVEKRLVMIIHVFYSFNSAGKVKKRATNPLFDFLLYVSHQ